MRTSDAAPAPGPDRVGNPLAPSSVLELNLSALGGLGHRWARHTCGWGRKEIRAGGKRVASRTCGVSGSRCMLPGRSFVSLPPHPLLVLQGDAIYLACNCLACMPRLRPRRRTDARSIQQLESCLSSARFCCVCSAAKGWSTLFVGAWGAWSGLG